MHLRQSTLLVSFMPSYTQHTLQFNIYKRARSCVVLDNVCKNGHIRSGLNIPLTATLLSSLIFKITLRQWHGLGEPAGVTGWGGHGSGCGCGSRSWTPMTCDHPSLKMCQPLTTTIVTNQHTIHQQCWTGW
jgi:hypothetical protein